VSSKTFSFLVILGAAAVMFVVPDVFRLAVAGWSKATGASEEVKIVHRQVPRVEIMKRFLGAIVPENDEKTWYFRLMDSELKVDPIIDDFNSFIRSTRFPADEKELITWTLPPGWKVERNPDWKWGEEGKIPPRYATVKLPDDEEIWVTPLPGKSGSVSMNINRWRGQLGLYSLGEAELEEFCRVEKVGDLQIRFVDMVGPGVSKTGGNNAMPFNPPQVAQTREKEKTETKNPPLTFTLPAGWKEVPPSEPKIITKAFEVVEGKEKASVTVSQLAGEGGGTLGNINRWRKPLMLPEVTEDELRKMTKAIDIGKDKGVFVDLAGAKTAPPERDRILGAIIYKPDSAWFFKMIGPTAFVGRQQANFEAFLKSVEFK